MEDTRPKLREINPPCKGCVPPVRHVGCHSECENYVKWRKERDSLLQEKSKNVKLNDNYLDVVYARHNKMKKHKNRQK